MSSALDQLDGFIPKREQRKILVGNDNCVKNVILRRRQSPDRFWAGTG